MKLQLINYQLQIFKSVGQRRSYLALLDSQGRTRGFQQMSQVFVGNALDIGIYEPGKNGRDAAAQGNELDLNINSTVLFLITPIGVEPPEEAAVIAGGVFMLVRTPDILHFGDLGSAVAAVFPGLIHRKKPDIKLRIVDDGNDGFAVQPKIKLEVVSLPVQYLGHGAATAPHGADAGIASAR